MTRAKTKTPIVTVRVERQDGTAVGLYRFHTRSEQAAVEATAELLARLEGVPAAELATFRFTTGDAA